MKAPFSDDNEAPDEESFGDFLEQADYERKKELSFLMFQDMMEKEKGNMVAPDTTGVDYFFLWDFITEDMRFDFGVIEQDFLKNCRARLEEFQSVGWYGEVTFSANKPLDAMQNSILRLIYNGAKIGDDYCVELIKNLYKVYHKREYNQLKRFTKINPDEIFSLSEDGLLGSDYATVGRIMGMCPFMGIELHENCSFMYKLLNRKREHFMEIEGKETEQPPFDDELFNACNEQVEEWITEAKKKDDRFMRYLNSYWDTSEFAGKCLREHGLVEDYAQLCIENNMGVPMQMVRTLAVLKKWKPKREFTFEEVQLYTNIYDMAAALSNVAECFDYEVSYLIGGAVDPFDVEDARFNPANMIVSVSSKKPEKKPAANVAPVSKGDVSKEDYLSEIADLRKRLHEKEQEIKYLREQYRDAKHRTEESEGLVKKYEGERDELIALREFAYNSEHGDYIIEEDKLPVMTEAIAGRKIVIIGGHVNWHNKLKQIFPDWLFIQTGAYKTVNSSMLEDKERVYFYTDYISHVSYKKFIAIVREKGIPFGYIGNYNIDNVVSQIYQDLGAHEV